MKHALLMGTAAAVILSAGVAAQGRNFAGTWTIDAEKTMAAGGGVAGARSGGGGARGGGGGGVVAVGSADAEARRVAVAGGGGGGARGAGGGVARSGGGGGGGAVMASPGMTVTIDASTFTIVQGQTETAYRTDGSVTNLDNATRRASATASWQGDKLVVDTTTDTPNGAVVTKATWYLEGESLVRENKSTGLDGQDIVRKTYYKRASQH